MVAVFDDAAYFNYSVGEDSVVFNPVNQMQRTQNYKFTF